MVVGSGQTLSEKYFKEVCKRACLPIQSPHALRHSHAVHLLEAGVNIKYVSERLGHSSIKMTADTYLHVTKKLKTKQWICICGIQAYKICGCFVGAIKYQSDHTL
ncbi:site-specific integrase [Bacillus swezeyi]|uniref:site-specific integrase n=1 Tax=Bacillus swezeyi TaxID=1925020 RepID=UPI0027DBA373|nr:site-specific integrase [Bacillus swezeyi]